MIDDQMKEKLAKAIGFRSKELFGKAQQIFEDLYVKYPDNAHINYHYGWLHDKMGEERKAMPFYERAIELGLAKDDLIGALLGLGSTYRTLGEYDKAIKMLKQGMDRFPDAKQFSVFLAMALYNKNHHAEAMHILLTTLATTSIDKGIVQYKDAIQFYADQLDKIWE